MSEPHTGRCAPDSRFGDLQLTPFEVELASIPLPLQGERSGVGVRVGYTIYRPFRGAYPITQVPHAGHAAVDWGMPNRTPLYCPFPQAQVSYTGYDASGYAYHIRLIDRTQGLMALLAHMPAKNAFLVSPGQAVSYHDRVGYSDNTGNSTGPHLHMELRLPPFQYANCINFLADLDALPGDEPPLPPPPDQGWLAMRAVKRCSVHSQPDKNSRVIGHIPAGQVILVKPYRANWVACGSGFIMATN